MYIILIILTLLTYLIGRATERLEPFYFLAVVLALCCGLRGEFVGRDTHSYHELFNTIALGRNAHIVEYGYILLIKFINFIGGTHQLVALLFAGFTIYCYFKFIIRYSNNVYLSLLLFVFMAPFYLSMFNQMRQYLSVGIFLAFLIPLIEQQKLIKFSIILILTAFFVHVSCIILFPFYFILHKKTSIYTKAIYIILFNVLIGTLLLLLLKTPYGYFITKRLEINVGVSLFAIKIVISFLLILLEKRTVLNEPNKVIFFNMAFFSIFLLTPVILHNNIPVEIFVRMNSYFLPFMIILVPESINRFSIKSKLIVLSLLIVFLLSYFIRGSIIMGQFYSLTPYSFNFNLFSF